MKRVNIVKSKLRRGVTKKEIRSTLEDDNVDDKTIEAVLNKAEEENSLKQFWTKNEKGTIKIVHILFKHFLEDNGFYNIVPRK